jgi:hypothetical protein
MAAKAGSNQSEQPFLLGSTLSLADCTWFPTCVFMDYMLPRVFGWPDVFNPEAGSGPGGHPAPPGAAAGPTPFPTLARWYSALAADRAAFRATRADIWAYWERLEREGQFEPIRAELAANRDPALKFAYGTTPAVTLAYQEPPPPGKATGRYIGWDAARDGPEPDDVVDEIVERSVAMRDAREIVPAPALDSHGFALTPKPTAVADFGDGGEVVRVYYEEMRDVVKAASGADRVFIFDHTIRESGRTNLNAAEGGAAAPVPRVHCDYTADGAPRRLAQLGREGIFSRLKNRDLNEEEVAQLSQGRFAFINVWRSICDDFPVMQKPLAVCDERSVPDADRFLYELRFPDRTGENYSLRHNDAHEWAYYSRMTKDECLVFKVYDKKEDGPRFVFHTAFDDPLTPADAPPRRSIEVRAIAFFDVAS